MKARGKRVYIDCLQNILGKTLATAYSARASDYAGVSTPVTWQEIDDGFDRTDFTIETAPARFEKVGDLWAKLRKSKGVETSGFASKRRCLRSRRTSEAAIASRAWRSTGPTQSSRRSASDPNLPSSACPLTVRIETSTPKRRESALNWVSNGAVDLLHFTNPALG